MRIIENVISDRGSKYAVSGGPVASAEEAKAFIKALCRNKKFAKATHNSWAVLLPDGPLKNDDGEAGAGMVILRMLEREGLEGHLICVTRWFGGKHLGGDRFRNVQEAVRVYLGEGWVKAAPLPMVPRNPRFRNLIRSVLATPQTLLALQYMTRS